MTAAQLDDAEGHTLVAAIHTRKAEPPPFDPAAPLPPMPDYRARSWEPAARRFRDLTEEEKEQQA